MCDVHICDKLAMKIVQAGPKLAVEILPPDYLLHILSCAICQGKIEQMVILLMEPPDHVM